MSEERKRGSSEVAGNSEDDRAAKASSRDGTGGVAEQRVSQQGSGQQPVDLGSATPSASKHTSGVGSGVVSGNAPGVGRRGASSKSDDDSPKGAQQSPQNVGAFRGVHGGAGGKLDAAQHSVTGSPSQRNNTGNGRGQDDADGEKTPSHMMGFGGTSGAGKDMKDQLGDDGRDAGGKKKSSTSKRFAKAGTATAAAGVVALPMVAAATTVTLVKNGISAAQMLLKAFIAWMKGLAASIGNAIVGAVGAVGSAVAGALGLTGSAVTIGTMVSVTFTTIMVGGASFFVNSYQAQQTAMRDGGLQGQCEPGQLVSANSAMDFESGAQTEDNARIIYSSLSGMGMPDENIAGILGNWDAESSIDPTGVETIFDEPFQIGPKKQAAWDAGWDVWAIDPDYAARYPAINQVGVGLGQWTNGRNILLMGYADRRGEPWYDLQTQLSFMFTEDDPSRVSYMHSILHESLGSPSNAALDFMSEWEGISDGSTAQRLQKAEQYMGQMAGWTVDQSVAGSILDAIDGALDSALGGASTAALASASQCDDGDAVFASGLNVAGVLGDDYPYREPKGVKGFGMPKTVFGHTQRECTDFTMWRINQAMGWTPDSGEDPPFTFANLGVSYGPGDRGAGSWMNILTAVDGISQTSSPQPGDIAWWGYNDVGGNYGHVGFVAAVNGDQVTIEHYNYTATSAYGVTTHHVSEIPGYIRIGEGVLNV